MNLALGKGTSAVALTISPSVMGCDFTSPLPVKKCHDEERLGKRDIPVTYRLNVTNARPVGPTVMPIGGSFIKRCTTSSCGPKVPLSTKPGFSGNGLKVTA